jgi:predicted esterase
MATDADFRTLAGHVLTLHERGHYQEAIAVVSAAADQFPDRAERTTYWRACLHCRLGEPDHAIATLREGLARGLWWSPEMLGEDPDLAPIHHRVEFATVVAACYEQRQAAQSAAGPGLQVVRPDRSDSQSPLLIALHWRGRDVADFAAWWHPAVRHGVVVALPRSSQQLGMHAFGWDDRERASDEVAAAYTTLHTMEAFDPCQVILAGASQGATLAMRLALAGDLVPATGFVAVVPAIRDPEELAPEIKMGARRGVRGWLLTGEWDDGRTEIEGLHAQLVGAGVPCQLEVIPGLGHDFPHDFAERLSAAIAFVLGEKSSSRVI